MKYTGWTVHSSYITSSDCPLQCESSHRFESILIYYYVLISENGFIQVRNFIEEEFRSHVRNNNKHNLSESHKKFLMVTRHCTKVHSK